MTISEAKQKLVDTALAEVGYREGGSNYNKYAESPDIQRLYGWKPQNQPWCCTFVNWVFLSAFGYDLGSKLTYGGTAACANSAQLFRNAGAFVYFPQVGDQAFFYSGFDINHTGLVVSVDGTVFTTVEGNYSDKVSTVKHNVGASDVAGFGRPNWSLAAQDQSAELTFSAGSASSENAQITTLKKGMIGEDVKALQKRLISLGYSCGPDGADGKYGNNTMKAVTQFQEDHNLTVTGEVDAKTLAALNNANGNEDDPSEEPKNEDANHDWQPPTLIESNAYSSSCVVLQGLLNVRHFPCGTVDGFFGDKTKKAVNAAKAFYGLKVNGVCDKPLWIKLLST